MLIPFLKRVSLEYRVFGKVPPLCSLEQMLSGKLPILGPTDYLCYQEKACSDCRAQKMRKISRFIRKYI